MEEGNCTSNENKYSVYVSKTCQSIIIASGEAVTRPSWRYRSTPVLVSSLGVGERGGKGVSDDNSDGVSIKSHQTSYESKYGYKDLEYTNRSALVKSEKEAAPPHQGWLQGGKQAMRGGDEGDQPPRRVAGNGCCSIGWVRQRNDPVQGHTALHAPPNAPFTHLISSILR
ncbi:hypothetical protein ABEB36_011326 [Hypothenemus hampei]|uniref:Uncharacterized protein n=1 Tax=Hypothenemus hampei TaxID=57062 RepID=A0ABD1EHV9_HYPHA